MTRYAALLRAINLGSRARVSMPGLRALVEGLGHDDVATYLQSGNVVFSAAGGNSARIAAGIRARIAEELDLDVAVLVRSAADLARVAKGNPFADRERSGDELHVTFLEDQPDAAKAAALAAPANEPAEFALEGREVYLFCPDGYGRTKLNNALFEKRLGVAATTRNWRTVRALADMTAG
jgi:uncharacterized protein (DUF1697 family)